MQCWKKPDQAARFVGSNSRNPDMAGKTSYFNTFLWESKSIIFGGNCYPKMRNDNNIVVIIY